MKKLYFLVLVAAFFLPPNNIFSQANCTETLNFNWKDASNNGFVWPISNGEPIVSRTYTRPGINGTLQATITLNNPNGRNIDMSNCGTAGNHFYTATHSDPNGGFNCGPGMNGQFSYGPDFLTLGMTSVTSSDVVSITFSFNYPTRISDLDIWDIDYQGGSAAGSWEDEINFEAKFFNTLVPVKVTSAGSAVIVTGNNSTALIVRSLYGPGNGNLAHTDPIGRVELATDVLVTSFTIIYSNGPNDDGESDDHAIKIGGFQVCPDFTYVPVPVKLTSFDGQKNNTHVYLDWETASEEDFKEFQVEYSENGLNYQKISSIAAKGNFGGTSHYNFEHSGILSSTSRKLYYRLKIVDIDGRFIYSKVVLISNTNVITDQLKVFPNPMQNGQNLILKDVIISSVIIYNAAGIVVFQNQYNKVNSVVIPYANLKSKGFFLVSVNGNTAKKIIVN